jgi:hypothetical protein
MHKSDNTDQYAGLTIHSTTRVAVSREYDNEPSAFMKRGKFLNYAGDDDLKNDSAQWSSFYSHNTNMKTTEVY